MVYTDDTIIFFEHREQTNQISSAKVVHAEESNLSDLLSFEKPKVISEFKGFLSKGDKGFLAYLNDKCVFRMWVKHGPQNVYLHPRLSMNIGENEAYIHYVETALPARGKGVCPHALCAAVADLGPAFRVYAAVLENNRASIRAFTKAGFEPKNKLRLIVFLGLPLVKPHDCVFLGFRQLFRGFRRKWPESLAE